MRFIWHEPKRQANLKKHDMDFADAERVFAGPTFTFEDNREDYGKQRWVTLGLLSAKVVVIVHTETEEEIRVISMREADIFWSPAYSGCTAGRRQREETTMWLSMVVCIITLTLGLFLAPSPSYAQAVAKTPRIGILTIASDPHSGFEGFRQGLRDLGYVEGQSITLEYRFAEGRFERLPALAAELVRLKVDVSSRTAGKRLRRHSMPPGQSPSSFRPFPTQWARGSSPAWHSRGGTPRS